MLELTAVFEPWLIEDGTYPPFQTGMLVNLSFQLELGSILPAKPSRELAFTHIGNAEYDYCGEILRIYGSDKPKYFMGMKLPLIKSKSFGPTLAIIDTGSFRFYIGTLELKKYKQGTRVRGRGTLLLDYSIWVEYLQRYHDPPDIFYALEVTGIRKVTIPERLISRNGGYKAMPTRVPPGDFGSVTELDTMDGQSFSEEFYIVDFKETDHRDIPKTYIF